MRLLSSLDQDSLVAIGSWILGEGGGGGLDGDREGRGAGGQPEGWWTVVRDGGAHPTPAPSRNLKPSR